MSRSYRRYALTLMTAVYALNLIDRGLINLLLQPIKMDLRLSDTQLGFLTGIAFAVFYAVAGVPIARWSDRGDRVTIASAAIGLWGLTVMSCVFVTQYVHLLIARVAAAVGESGCKPPTYSLVGDYFPDPAERTRAMATYWLGSPLATLVSFVLGGWLNEIYGWRVTFFLMGIPGLLLAVLMRWTIKDPRACRSNPLAEQKLPPMKLVLLTLWRRRSCRHLCIALILLYTMGSGLSPWYAAFLIRSHGMSTVELGTWLGLILGSSGLAGVWMGGYVIGRWFDKNEAGQMRMTALAVSLLVPCFVAFLTVPHKYQALLALAPLIAVFNFFYAPVYALLQRLVSDDMRATTMAVVMLLANLIGMGLGPQIVGILSDILRPAAGSDSLRYALLALSFVALWSAYHFWRVARTVHDDLSSPARLGRINAETFASASQNP